MVAVSTDNSTNYPTLHITYLQTCCRIIAFLTRDVLWTAKFEAAIPTETFVPSDRLVTADRYRAFVSVSIRMNDLVHWDRITTEFLTARLMVFGSKLLSELVGTWNGVTGGQRKLQRKRAVQDVSSTVLTHLLWFIQNAPVWNSLRYITSFVTFHQIFPKSHKIQENLKWAGNVARREERTM